MPNCAQSARSHYTWPFAGRRESRMGRAATTTLVGISIALAATLTVAQTRPAKPALSGATWGKGNRVLVGVTQERIGFSAHWRFQRSADEDILIDLEESRAGNVRAGSLLLIGKNALLARDVPLQPGQEVDAFDGPLLMLQLVLRLLERAVPAGPGGLKQDVQVDIRERNRSIKVTGIGSDGEFYAPWSLKGVIGPVPGGQVRFELEFVSASRSADATPYETRLAGIWEITSPPVQLPDSTPLRGWRVYELKPVVKARGATNDVGLGASVPMAFPTLGEVRKRALEWASEGARRARWQCR